MKYFFTQKSFLLTFLFALGIFFLYLVCLNIDDYTDFNCTKLTVTNSRTILGWIIGGITCVLGVPIAVLIVTIQYYQSKFGDYGVKKITSNHYFLVIGFCLILILFLSFATFIGIDCCDDKIELTVIRVYYLFILFIVGLCSFFVTFKKIITSLSINEILLSLNEEMSGKDIVDYCKNSNQINALEKRKKLDELTNDEKKLYKKKRNPLNPLIVIKEITSLAIKNDDEILLEGLFEIRSNIVSKVSQEAIKTNTEFLTTWNILFLYDRYWFLPAYMKLLKNKDEISLCLLIEEACEIIQSYHLMNKFGDIRELTNCLYSERLNELLDEKLYNVINKIITCSIYNLYEIIETDYEKDNISNKTYRSDVDDFFKMFERVFMLSIERNFLPKYDLVQQLFWHLIIKQPALAQLKYLKTFQFKLSEARRKYFIDSLLHLLTNIYIKAFEAKLIQQHEIDKIILSRDYANCLRKDNTFALSPISIYLNGLTIFAKTNTVILSNFIYNPFEINKPLLQESLEFAFTNHVQYRSEIKNILESIKTLKNIVFDRNDTAEKDVINSQIKILNACNQLREEQINELNELLKEINKD